jgi:hypothetical protein
MQQFHFGDGQRPRYADRRTSLVDRILCSVDGEPARLVVSMFTGSIPSPVVPGGKQGIHSLQKTNSISCQISLANTLGGYFFNRVICETSLRLYVGFG